jgi:4-amino-4-deoxy-L-arabinose transferase-like glycosyltransferase
MLRLPSALAGAGTVVLLYFLAKCTFSRGVALLSTSGLALSALHIYYSQDVRMYALLGFWASASFLSLALIASDERKGDAHRLGRWAAYVFFTGAGLYTHYYMILAVLSQNLIWAASPARKRVGWKAWLVSQLCLVVIFIPWLPFLVSQLPSTMAATSAINWRETVGWKDAALTALSFCLGHYQREDRLFFGVLAVPALAVFGAAAYIGLKRVTRLEKPGDAICLAYLLPVPLALLGGVFVPGYQLAYVTISLPGWFLLLGIGVSQAGLRLVERRGRGLFPRTAIGLPLLLLLAASAVHYHRSPSAWRADWREACRTIEAAARPHDTALFAYDVPVPWRYYARGKIRAAHVGRFDPWKGESPPAARLVHSELEARVGRSRRIYLCTYLLDVFDPHGNIAAWVRSRARVIRKLQFRGVEFLVADMQLPKSEGLQTAPDHLTL